MCGSRLFEYHSLVQHSSTDKARDIRTARHRTWCISRLRWASPPASTTALNLTSIRSAAIVVRMTKRPSAPKVANGERMNLRPDLFALEVCITRPAALFSVLDGLTRSLSKAVYVKRMMTHVETKDLRRSGMLSRRPGRPNFKKRWCFSGAAGTLLYCCVRRLHPCAMNPQLQLGNDANEEMAAL